MHSDSIEDSAQTFAAYDVTNGVYEVLTALAYAADGFVWSVSPDLGVGFRRASRPDRMVFFVAIKGNAHTKTTWAFEERPVASSKLNIWDDRLEAGLELIHFLAAQVWSGTDGVARGATADDLKAVANSPATMGVLVEPGYAFISSTPYKLAAQTPTADVTAPVSNPRIDLVQAGLETWNISVKQGVESVTPIAPTADADSIALAQLYVRTTATSIKDTDDSTNGYIIDARDFL